MGRDRGKARMAANDQPNRNQVRANGSMDRSASAPGQEKPDWADGLKQLYDSVVDEPLPDTFRDLLDQLDSSDDERGGEEGGSR